MEVQTLELVQELKETRARLAEAEETLRALRGGEADALVIEGGNGPQIYTLKSASEPYRMLVEQMREGALTVSGHGIILYSNEASARILGKPAAAVAGSTVFDFISQSDFESLAAPCGSPGLETVVKKAGGGHAAVLISSAPLRVEGQDLISIVITDLTRQQLRLRYETIIESITQPVYLLSRDLVIESWNRGAEKLYGFSADEIIGRPERDLCSGDNERKATEDLAVRVEQLGEALSYDARRSRKDGSIVHIIFYLAPLRDSQGSLTGYVAIAHDITERKAEERTRQLLLDELNHRVKNTLAIVQSIARQTLSQTQNPAGFAASFFGRLQALAGAHNILTASSWQTAGLDRLVRDQLILGGANNARFFCSGPEVSLFPQVAVSLALVLHELGTNARKYGALSVPDGVVELIWEIDPAEPAVNLRWQEKGGPPVSVPAHRGFGSLMIERSLKGVGGRAGLRFETSGLICTIRLPLSAGNHDLPGSDDGQAISYR
jgi:PAS domain S-box-containing protein